MADEFVAGQVRDAVVDLLLVRETGALSTVRADGSPAVSTMFFAGDGLRVYLHTFPYTRKYFDLQRDSRVSYTLLHQPPGGYESRAGLRMVQISGRATLVGGDEAQHALRLCGSQFGWLASRERLESFQRDAAAGVIRFFRIDAESGLWNDNRVGPGWRVLLTIDGDDIVDQCPSPPPTNDGERA